MSLWDSFTSTVSSAASSAYNTAGSALSSAFNQTEAVTSNLLSGAKQSLSAVGEGLSKLAEKGIIAATMDDGKAAMPSPGPDSAQAKKSGSAGLIVAAAGGLALLYVITRKKG